MARKVISTSKAPAAIGTYSQAVAIGDTVYLSGQIPLIAESMEVIEGDVKEQVRQVFRNLSAVCEAADGSLAEIVKLNVYLTDLGNFGFVNEVMEEFFSAPFPARAAVGVAQLPKDVPVEIEGVMVTGS